MVTTPPLCSCCALVSRPPQPLQLAHSQRASDEPPEAPASQSSSASYASPRLPCGPLTPAAAGASAASGREDRASKVKHHAEHVWGPAWEMEDRPAPKVFSLVGKSASEVRELSGLVCQGRARARRSGWPLTASCGRHWRFCLAVGSVFITVSPIVTKYTQIGAVFSSSEVRPSRQASWHKNI